MNKFIKLILSILKRLTTIFIMVIALNVANMIV